mmetsp:Transcript_37629/g.80316  ORF Transcript_37629/g.80316 Transcript_37629/m.80316 type:complete len:229 (+) Transcript_37629:94-780(+)|eukprot:CAMPEP_0172528614 /NCGR_PEP_ID=MMETSP1067-20121228/2957_1 /TAXON_ID=265564 ORGANISM="Thalassiosira punctigera, Strain Tpunct2005C2" /NCGR_SAMPLE_ID=MMETSP1067 /ASSEMBLY_ACC=CAM_ASM_000444 /LENGTH=228 /DNA_ID=CAMNT_0013312559 /DNA_START=90 /DNA_END=776 /DNA_ORIENTATION=+
MSLSHGKFVIPLLVAIAAVLLSMFGRDLLEPPSDAAAPAASERIIDGVAFPGEIKAAGAKQLLIGGGTRSKWGFKVYALGIYSDPKLIKSLKKKYPGDASGTNLSKDFGEGKQARTLLLRFRRGVASADISEALGEALVDKIGEEKSSQFSQFVLDVVGSDRLEKGSEVYISCKGERLWSSLAEGKEALAIGVKGLCAAIFEVYLGSGPVSPQAKDGFEKGFADLTMS